METGDNFIKYTESTSADSFGEVNIGKEKGRITIGEDDPRYRVAALKTSGILGGLVGYIAKKSHSYVELQVDKAHILVNVNSLAKRFNISKEEILQAAEEGTLETLIKEKTPLALLNKYMQNYTKSKTGTLIHNKTKIDTSMSYNELKKVAMVIMATPLDQRITINLKHHQFSIIHTGDDRIELVFHKEIIKWEGGYGVVNPELLVGEGENVAVKQAKDFDAAKKDVKNEIKMVDIANGGNKKTLGIQYPTRYKVFNFANGPEEIGYIAPLYNHNYHKEIENNAPVKNIRLKQQMKKNLPKNLHVDMKTPVKKTHRDFSKEFYQIFKGYETLKNKKIIHGDLKPGNLLVKIDDKGNKHVHIADFGGANVEDNLKKTASTPEYAPKQEVDEEDRLFDELQRLDSTKDRSKIDAINAQIITIKRRRDIFALGCICYEACNNLKRPYPKVNPNIDHKYATIADRSPDFSKGYTELPDNAAPNVIRDLIRDMLNPDPKKRPTIKEVVKCMEDYIKTDPQLEQEIAAFLKLYETKKLEEI